MFTCLVLATLLTLPGIAAAEDFTVITLGRLLNRMQASRVSFVEHQYRKALKTPIERRGELTFEPPATFEKHVLVPDEERYRLINNTLSIELPGRKTRQLSTRNQPLLRALLLGFQAVVSGRLESLSPFYQVTLSGNAQDWQLLLTPIDAEVAHYIANIVVIGRQAEPRQFAINERNGDRTLTEITP